jgi:phosphate transport system permease protein
MIRSKILGHLIVIVTGLSTALILLSIVVMLWIITAEGIGNISWEFLTTPPSNGMTGGGIFPAIIGTFLMVILMSLIGVPVGTITAIYLTQYARQDSMFAKWIRFAVNTLAGVPAIVFGLFGLGFFIQFVGKGIDHLAGDGSNVWGQPGLLWASLTMAMMTLPVVIVSVEEAIRAVPRELSEASLALGATRWQTIWKIVIPNSIGGIMTGAILAVSRGAGEVAPILFTGVAYFLPHLPGALSDQFMHLGYHLYILTTQSADVEATIGIQYATTFVLLILTFCLNFSAIFLRQYLRNRISR